MMHSKNPCPDPCKENMSSFVDLLAISCLIFAIIALECGAVVVGIIFQFQETSTEM